MPRGVGYRQGLCRAQTRLPVVLDVRGLSRFGRQNRYQDAALHRSQRWLTVLGAIAVALEEFCDVAPAVVVLFVNGVPQFDQVPDDE